MLFHDKQKRVDKFILGEDGDVPMTPAPPREKSKAKPKREKVRMETTYTRLRNEFAHRRPGVNIGQTRAQMAARVGGLLALAKRAIELNP